MSKPSIFILVCLGILLFQVANLSYWARFKVWEPTSFATVSERVLQEPQVSQLLSKEILKNLQSNEPPSHPNVQVKMEAAVVGILQSPLMRGILNLVSQALFKALNAKISEGVTLNLQTFKQDISALLKNFNQNGAILKKLETIPNQVTLIEAGKIPPLHKIKPTLFWVFMGCGLSALGIFMLVLFKNKEQRFLLKWLGGLLWCTSLLLYLSLFPIRKLVLSYTSTPTETLFANAFFKELTYPLKIQLGVLFLIGVGIWVGVWFNNQNKMR